MSKHVGPLIYSWISVVNDEIEHGILDEQAIGGANIGDHDEIQFGIG
jgi:hypothetical protein